MKKRMTKILAAGMALALMVGTFAFFTDRTTQKTTGTAGNIDLVFTDNSVNTYDAATAADAVIGNNEFCQSKVWEKGALLTAADKVLNPGDAFNLDYQLTNPATKSIDVRQRIVLTSSVEMTSLEAAEYHLTITGGNNETAVTGVLQGDNKTIIYDLEDIIINGTKEAETGAIKDGETDVAKYTVRLDFEKNALNAFMNSTVTIDLYATAKQHRNTTNADDFPAFENLGSITNNPAIETIGGKAIEKIG